jgi:enterochelin esterase-like enzyme
MHLVFRGIRNAAVLVFVLLSGVSHGDASTAEDAKSGQVRRVNWVTEAVKAPRLEQRIFASRLLGTGVSYHLYSPEAYDSDPGRRFPVIYWLHGHNASPATIPDVLQHYAEAMQQGLMPPAVVVFPNGMAESMWIDSRDGVVPMESLLVKELVVDVDANFRTIDRPEGRLLEGFSMGGYGAARLGAKYPEIFGSVSMLGAGPMQREFVTLGSRNEAAAARKRIWSEVYGNDRGYFRDESPWTLADLNAVRIRKALAIRIVIGERDSALEPNREFSAFLTRSGIRNTFQVVPGVGHNPLQLLHTLGDDNWRFYRAVLLARINRAARFSPTRWPAARSSRWIRGLA